MTARSTLQQLTTDLYRALIVKCLVQNSDPSLNTWASEPQTVEQDEDEFFSDGIDVGPSGDELDTGAICWHKFLDKLCVLCHLHHAGDTVVSIGVEDTNSGSCFWLAANDNRVAEPVKLLKLLLRLLSNVDDREEKEISEAIQKASINCSSNKVHYYRTKLKLFADQAEAERQQTNGSDVDLVLLHEALQRLITNGSVNHVLFCAAVTLFDESYASRILWTKASDGIKSYRLIRHFIGRLRSWKRAADFVAACAASYGAVLANSSVNWVECYPVFNKAQAINFSGSLDDLLSQVCPTISRSDALRNGTARRLETATGFLKRLQGPEKTPQVPLVHVETAIAHHFHQNNLQFLGADRYIACSKPSCYCCGLYLLHHPGKFAKRPVHGTAWLQWAYPRCPKLRDKSRSDDLENISILRSMLEDIYRDIEASIRNERFGVRREFDSTTGTGPNGR